MNNPSKGMKNPMKSETSSLPDDIDAQMAQSAEGRFADLFQARIAGILKVLQDTADGSATSAGAFSFSVDAAGKVSVSQFCGKMRQEVSFTL